MEEDFVEDEIYHLTGWELMWLLSLLNTVGGLYGLFVKKESYI